MFGLAIEHPHQQSTHFARRSSRRPEAFPAPDGSPLNRHQSYVTAGWHFSPTFDRQLQVDRILQASIPDGVGSLKLRPRVRLHVAEIHGMVVINCHMISKDYRAEHRHKYRNRQNSWDFQINFSFQFLFADALSFVTELKGIGTIGMSDGHPVITRKFAHNPLPAEPAKPT